MKNYSMRFLWSDCPGFVTEARLKITSSHAVFIFKLRQSELSDQSY